MADFIVPMHTCHNLWLSSQDTVFQLWYNFYHVASLHAGGWMAGRKNEVAILNSRGQVWAGWRVDKVSEGSGAGRGVKNRLLED